MAAVTVVKAEPTTEEKPSMGLSLVAFIFRGDRTSCKRLIIGGACLSSYVSIVKERVMGLLERKPDVIELLIGNDIALDDKRLSEYTRDTHLCMKALVWYSDQPAAWRWFNEELADLEGQGTTALTQSRWESMSTCLESTSSPAPSPKVRPALPRPLLTKAAGEGPTLACLGREGHDHEEVGNIWQMPVDCKIFIGLHWHVRSCRLQVTAGTAVGELEEQLRAWLATPPDELLLLCRNAVLESDARLEQYKIGVGDRLLVMAYYKLKSFENKNC